MRKIRLFLLASILVLGVASIAVATPTHGYDVYFFEDNTWQNVVGGRFYDCGSILNRWGTVTSYSWAIEWACDYSSGEYCTLCEPGGCQPAPCQWPG